MKAGINGVINLSVLDGWWGESYDGTNGWAIKPVSEKLSEEVRTREETSTLYELLQDQVLPLYYGHGKMGFSPNWVKMSKRSMATIMPRFNSKRMVGEYLAKYYLPASKQYRLYRQNNYENSHAIAAWKSRVRKAWTGVSLRGLGFARLLGTRQRCLGDAPDLQLRRRRRHQPAVHPAVLPGWQGAGEHRQLLRHDRDADAAGHRDAGDPNTGFEAGQTQVFPDGTYWDQYRIGGTSLSSPLLSSVVAVAGQLARHPLGFINPLYYRMLGTAGLHDNAAPKSPVAQVRTDYVNFLDNSQGKFYRLQTIDVQTSTLHSTPGYDDETGVGTPSGPAFFFEAARLSGL